MNQKLSLKDLIFTLMFGVLFFYYILNIYYSEA